MTVHKPKQRDYPLKFSGFHNQSPLLTMFSVSPYFFHKVFEPFVLRMELN